MRHILIVKKNETTDKWMWKFIRLSKPNLVLCQSLVKYHTAENAHGHFFEIAQEISDFINQKER